MLCSHKHIIVFSGTVYTPLHLLLCRSCLIQQVEDCWQRHPLYLCVWLLMELVFNQDLDGDCGSCHEEI